MFTVMVIFHTIICILLVIVVLMQSAKGEGLAGAFGGGGSGLTGAVFGGRGAVSFLSKATTILAVIFMVNCGVLAYMSKGRMETQAVEESAVSTEAAQDFQQQQQQQEAFPGAGSGQQPGTMPGEGDTQEGQPAPTQQPPAEGGTEQQSGQ